MDDQETKRRQAIAAETEQIDRVLRLAKPQPDAARQAALLERIVLTAERTPRLVSAPVAQHPPALQPRTPFTQSTWAKRDLWGSLSILAASLVIGIVAGQSSLSDRAVHGFEDATGFTLASAAQDAAMTFALVETGDED